MGWKYIRIRSENVCFVQHILYPIKINEQELLTKLGEYLESGKGIYTLVTAFVFLSVCHIHYTLTIPKYQTDIMDKGSQFAKIF